MLQMNFRPFPELVSERLTLRRLTKSDAEELYILRSNEDVLRYLGKEAILSITDAERLIAEFNRNAYRNESVVWGMTLSENTSKIIGTICLWNFKKENYRAEIGYILHPQHWRKGLMKEAIQCVTDYGFNVLKLHSIEALLSPQNIASSGVLEKSGFVKEGYLKENFFFRGNFSDTVIYSRLQ